jgi:cell division inhibitor SulA
VARGDAGTRSQKYILGRFFLCVSASLREMIWLRPKAALGPPWFKESGFPLSRE